MPLQQIKRDGRKGWRWGTHGKVYFGPNAKDKALKQARAIKATGWTENSFCPTGIGGGIDPSCSGELDLRSGSKDRMRADLRVGGEEVGTVEVLTDLRPIATMENLEVWKEHRGKGHAKTLYRKTFAELKKQGFTEVQSSENLQETGEAVWKSLQRDDPTIKYENGIYRKSLIGATTNAVPKKRSKASYNPLRMDPTRTAALRRKFSAEVKRRYKLLKADIRKFVVDDDCFGLDKIKHVRNAFCPTGEGGGQDNSCSPSSSYSGTRESALKVVKHVLGSEIKGSAEKFVEKQVAKKIKLSHDMGWGQPDKEHITEWTEQYQKEFDDHLSNGMKYRTELDGERWVEVSITHQMRDGGEGTYAARIDFGVSGRSDRSVQQDVEHESVSMLRKVREYAKKFHEAGMPVEVEGADQRRNDLYAKWMPKLGFTKSEVRGKKIIYNYYGALVSNAPKHKFQFLSTSAQQQAFLAWLKKQVQFRIMGNTVEQIEKAWWTQYAEAGYRQGAGRAFDDVQQKATGKAGVGDFYQGSKDEFLRSSFGRPVQVERIKILASRTYQDLVGINEAMATGISRSLLDGLVRGDNPRTIADDIEENVEGIGAYRAETIARTEIIRAHAEGQLDALEAMGVEQVGVMVEWSTAGDDRVCSLCEELEGVVLKLSEAHNKIPFHPNCRCSFLPANVGEDEDDQIRGKSKIESAFEDAGLEVEISSERPESILNMNPNHDEQGRFASGDNGSSSQPTEWSDKQTFKHAVSTGMVEDGLHTVEPFVYKVKDGKAEIQKGLNSKFDYDTGEYKITERELPPERLEDREYVHHTQADIASAIDLKIGSGYGRWGENEFNAVYFFQDKTHYADGNTFGTKKHKIKLAPGTKIARPGPELAEALEKHEGFAQEKMIKAGYHGYAKLDERGDVWELALFDTSRIVQNVFCPTGEGGGVDPSCSPGQGSALPKDASALKNLKLVNFLGGSTGAKLMEDEHGNKYVWKTGKSHGQIRAEQAAHDAYVAAGVPMVESKLYETEDGPVKIAKYVEGKTYNELDAKDKAIVKAEMQKHFAVDAVLANWDVVGQSNDNVMLGKDGKVYRIDVGGSLDYRAQGGPKGAAWNDQAIEMESMRTSYKNPNAKAMFGDMTKEQVAASAELMESKALTIIKSLPEQYRLIVADRIDNAVAYAKSMPDPKNPADTMPKVIIPANLGAGSGHMSESSKAFKEELKSGLPNLHHGKGLADHLKSTGMKATETYFKKIEVLNPDGIKNGTLVVPGQIKALKEKMIAHMKAALPPVNYKTGHLSIKKWETGKESQYVKTSTVGAKAWAGSHEAIDYSAPVIVAPVHKSATITGSQSKWLSSLTPQESNAIGSWKGGNSKAIRMNIAEGKLGEHEKGIMSAIEKAPRFSGIAYRGIHGEFAESIAKSIMDGGVGSIREIPYPAGFSRNSYTSMTTGGGTELFLRIRTNNGRVLEGSHGFASEQEFLIPQGSKVRVLGFTKNKQVEYYDHAGKKEGTTKVKYFVDLEHID